jgi:hypothetical protein
MQRLRAQCFLISVLAACGGCERKAPGPAECVRFAYLAYGVARVDAALPGRIQGHVDALIRTCLTSPYDRMLLQCFEETRQMRTCLREFEARQGRNVLPEPGEPL